MSVVEQVRQENIENLEIAGRCINAYLRANYHVNATSTIVQDSQAYPMLIVKPVTPAAGRSLTNALNAMAANHEYRGVPLGQIAEAEDSYNGIGPVVMVRGRTEDIATLAERLQLRELAPA